MSVQLKMNDLVEVKLDAAGGKATLTGQVFASDPSRNLLILRQKLDHTHLKANYVIVNVATSHEIKVVGHEEGHTGRVQLIKPDVIQRRIARAMEKHTRAVRRLGRGVTVEEQKFFDAMLPLFQDAEWAEDGAIVFSAGRVRLSRPYTADSLTVAPRASDPAAREKERASIESTALTLFREKLDSFWARARGDTRTESLASPAHGQGLASP